MKDLGNSWPEELASMNLLEVNRPAGLSSSQLIDYDRRAMTRSLWLYSILSRNLAAPPILKRLLDLTTDEPPGEFTMLVILPLDEEGIVTVKNEPEGNIDGDGYED